MLQRGQLVPHFAVTKLDGARASYGDIWQRKNLLLVVLPVEGSAERAEYVAQLEDRSQDFIAHETHCVVTADAVPDLPVPGLLIADRWGEIFFVAGGPLIADLPKIDEILEWLRFLQQQCPECEGEAR